MKKSAIEKAIAKVNAEIELLQAVKFRLQEENAQTLRVRKPRAVPVKKVQPA